jgi:hypothetical protein
MIVVSCLVWALVSCRAEQSPLTSDSLTPRQRELGAQLEGITTSYLNQKIGIASFGGQKFCGYKLLDVEETDKGISEYVDVLCQEFYLKGNGKLAKGTGISLPVALILAKSNGSFDVIKHQTPRDGDQFVPDIEAMFPRKVQSEILSDQRTRWNEPILSQLTIEAEKHYASNSNKTP